MRGRHHPSLEGDDMMPIPPIAEYTAKERSGALRPAYGGGPAARVPCLEGEALTHASASLGGWALRD